jgi:hypothetical protein
LRFADRVIERGAQLDQLRLLILSREWRQMQFVVDAEFTRLCARLDRSIKSRNAQKSRVEARVIDNQRRE